MADRLLELFGGELPARSGDAAGKVASSAPVSSFSWRGPKPLVPPDYVGSADDASSWAALLVRWKAREAAWAARAAADRAAAVVAGADPDGVLPPAAAPVVEVDSWARALADLEALEVSGRWSREF